MNTVGWSRIQYVIRGIIVGAVVGVVISLFRLGIGYVFRFIQAVYTTLNTHPIWAIPWLVVSVIVVIGLQRFICSDSDVRGSGISVVKDHLTGVSSMRWYSVLWRKFFGGILSIGSGLAFGRQGPAVQLGGVVGLGINQLLKGNRTQENILLSAGAGAGLAAAFNTPVSGMMFIVEDVHHKFSKAMLLTTFSAAVMANYITSIIIRGHHVLEFGVLDYFPLRYYGYLVLLGCLVAVVGKSYMAVSQLMMAQLKKRELSRFTVSIMAVVVMLPIGMFSPRLLGGGEQIIREVSSGAFPYYMVFVYFVCRFLFMHLAHTTELPGGTFFPTLTLGALIGGLVGGALIYFNIVESVFLTSFVVYAMGGLLTAMTRASLTSVLLILEVTGSVTHVMPLAVVCLSAYVVSDWLQATSLYKHRYKHPTKTQVMALNPLATGQVETISIIIEPDGQLIDQSIRYLDMPCESQVIKVSRHHKEVMLQPSTVLKANDTVYIQVDSGAVKCVMDYMDQLNQPFMNS